MKCFDSFLQQPKHNGKNKNPVACFKYDFNIEQDITKAQINITALGLYKLFVNNLEVTDRKFLPGWTQYNKRLFYNSFNITKKLTKNNTLKIYLADGWYASRIAKAANNDKVIIPKISLECTITYADGSKKVINSLSKGWLCANDGEIRYSDIYDGEFYDANYKYSAWEKPIIVDNKVKVVKSNGAIVKKIEQISPKTITKIAPKIYIVDFGQNITGSELLNATIPKGVIVKIRHGEVLNFDGTLYTKNLRSSEALTTIIGDGNKISYQANFTYYGFRYIEITGIDDFEVSALVIHSYMKKIGDFSCSNQLVNQLYKNIIWGAKGNFLEVPTDCPQRDERRGWLGDAQVFIKTALYNFDCNKFFSKWLDDVDLACNEEGSYPAVAPDFFPNFGKYGQAGWADAGIICPWQLYLFSGDKNILSKHYLAMSNYLRYQKNIANNYIYDEASHGDWLNDNDPTSKEFIGTAFFANNAIIMSKIAKILKTKDYDEFADIRDNIKLAFAKKFIDSENEIIETSQTALSLALQFDLLSTIQRKKAAKKLNNKVINNNYHLSCGFLGTPHLLYALSENGYVKTAYKLLLQTKRPSWLYPVTMGATTIWERWDSLSENGFADPSMNSFNHYAYGAVSEWLFAVVGGLKIIEEEPAFKTFILNPIPNKCISKIKVSYISKYGKIKIEIKQKKGDVFIAKFTVPENTNCLWQNKELLSKGTYTRIIENE